MRLESGPAKADRNWQLVRAVLFLGFAGYFVYDGAVGYPAKNRAAAIKTLEAAPFKGQVNYDQLGESPTESDFNRLRAARPTSVDNVHAALGKPAFSHQRGGSREDYFMGRYGYARVEVIGSAVNPNNMQWTNWAKSESEVRNQFYFALVPLPFGLYFLWRVIKAIGLKVVIDDEGMIYDGRLIRFSQMVALRDYNPKGWIDLYYTVDNTEKKLRLDWEKVARFDEIIAAICDARGFRNELALYKQRKAREEAEGEEET